MVKKTAGRVGIRMTFYLPDTNVFIYAYKGEEPFAKHVFKWITQKSLVISAIVAAEFLTGGDESERIKFEALLDHFGTISVDTAVARIAADYRRRFLKSKPGLKLPDAFIAATCKLHGSVLVSENPSDFPMTDIKKMKL